jgi:hypothetical protein
VKPSGELEMQRDELECWNRRAADGEPCRSCNHAAWDRELDLGENIEMIGEREIMIDVLLLPDSETVSSLSLPES